MADKTSKINPKRLSKGKRTHVRRLKQAARKAGTAHSLPTRASRHRECPRRRINHNSNDSLVVRSQP